MFSVLCGVVIKQTNPCLRGADVGDFQLNSLLGDVVNDLRLQSSGVGPEAPFKYAVKTVGPENQEIVLAQIKRCIVPGIRNSVVRADGVSSGSELTAPAVDLINSGVGAVIGELNLESVLAAHCACNVANIRDRSRRPDTAFLLRHGLNGRWNGHITIVSFVIRRVITDRAREFYFAIIRRRK